MAPARSDAATPETPAPPAPVASSAPARSVAPARPSIRMVWAHLLFMHWRIDADLLRPLVPAGLEIDTFDGSAWIGVIPFTMPLIGPTRLPPLLAKRRVHEINVRTYVTGGDDPGVWFFSLDCASALAVRLARSGFHLPYYRADIELRRADRTIRYTSRRRHRGAPPALFDATWQVGGALPRSKPGELSHFLTERYCLYSAHKGALYRGRIEHEPWPLREASLQRGVWRSSMIESHGLPEPEESPHLLYCDRLDPIMAWRLEAV